MKGGHPMEQQINVEFEEMVSKLQQHEELIIQLLGIIARTNKRVSDLSKIGVKPPSSSV